MTTNIVVNGPGGRMGKTRVRACCESKHTTLIAALARASADCCGSDAGLVAGIDKQSINISSVANPDDWQDPVWVDFTLPQGAIDALAFCQQHKIPMVIGTTGFNAEQKAQIQAASQIIPLVFAPNMSVGVNLCLSIPFRGVMTGPKRAVIYAPASLRGFSAVGQTLSYWLLYRPFVFLQFSLPGF